jgi:hypothetical protein
MLTESGVETEKLKSGKNLGPQVKTRTLHTPKGFGIPAGFSGARTKHRCRAEGFATRLSALKA